MARYKFRALRQMRVGDSVREPGQLVPEASGWPNLRHYLALEWVEKLSAAEDDPEAVEYPPVPQNRLSEILEPTEREPAPVVVAGKRRIKGGQSIRCGNCRKSNHLPPDFSETRTWMCWDCAQPQTLLRAREHPSPVSVAEYAESVDARFVDDQGDLTDAWQATVSG